jgi:hypothetical protein
LNTVIFKRERERERGSGLFIVFKERAKEKMKEYLTLEVKEVCSKWWGKIFWRKIQTF